MYATDSQGNTALHMLVIHNLPGMYSFVDSLWSDLYENVPEKRAGRPPLRQVRNSAGVTPLQLAAQLGRARMFEHIMNASCQSFWKYGPIQAMHYPLDDLDGVHANVDEEMKHLQEQSQILERVSQQQAALAKRTHGLVDEDVLGCAGA